MNDNATPDRLQAQVVYRGMSNGEDIEIIQVGVHKIQYGHGHGGGGFCYACQSFDCIDNLTDAERKAVNNAL